MTSPQKLRGATAPRVSVHPPYTRTHGYFAGKLMAAAGKPLEQWQQDACDIMMSLRDDDKWLCFEYAEWVARQNGKGGIGEARVLAGFLLLDEETIVWSAHQVRTAMQAFKRFKQLFKALGTEISDTLIDIDGVRIKVINGNGNEGFERLDTGATIVFNSRSNNALRGFSVDLLIVDEAYAYPPEQDEAVKPTLLARPNGQIVYLSSPPLTGDTGKVMYALRRRAEAGGDARFGYRDWGIAGVLDTIERIDLDDTTLWAASNPALGNGRVTLETIQILRNSMKANNGRGFGREILGLWPREIISGGGSFDLDLWRALLDPESQRKGDVAIAVDIAPKRDYACISLVGFREDGFKHGQVVSYHPGTEWLVDGIDTPNGRVAGIVELAAALKPVAITMGPGTGKSLKTELDKRGLHLPEDPDKPERGDLMIVNTTEMGAAFGLLFDSLNQATFRHLGQGPLDESIEGAVIVETNDGLRIVRKDSSADTSPTVSFALALWGFDARAHLIDKNDEPFQIW